MSFDLDVIVIYLVSCRFMATSEECYPFLGIRIIKKPADRSAGFLHIWSFYVLLSSLLACSLLTRRRRLRLSGLLGLAAGRLLSLAASGLLRDGLLDGLLGRSLLLSLLRSHVVFVLSFWFIRRKSPDK